MVKDYAVFIISCAQNSQVLSLLIDSIRENFSKDIKIYVSTDGKMNIEKDENIEVLIHPTNNFGRRMYLSLDEVREEKIIVFCDDFIIEECANVEELDELATYLDKGVASIALAKISGKNENEELLGKYIRRSQHATYKTTLQCAFWRRDIFKELIHDAHSPWEFELYSNFRTYNMKEKFYALKDDSLQPLPYNRGKLIIRGHVVVPEKGRLEKKLGKKIDLSDFPETTSYVQGRNMSVGEKIKRRIILWTKDKFYRFKK